MKVSMILAMDRNCLIGKGDQLPWRHPEDLLWFKQQTIDKPILMGRTTYEGLGRPLPNRPNIVLSRSDTNLVGDVARVQSYDDAYLLADTLGYDDLMIIGGKQVYESLIDHADCIYVTVIDHDYNGDVHMTHPLFEALAGCDLSEKNPAFTNLGFDRLFVRGPESERQEAWDVEVLNRVLSNDVMLNFVKLTRCH